MQKIPDRSGASYLPARYRQTIDAKKRRRFYKKIVTISALLIAVAVVYFVLSGPVLSLFKGATVQQPSTGGHLLNGSSVSTTSTISPASTTTTIPVPVNTALAVSTQDDSVQPPADIKITAGQVKIIVNTAFPSLHPDIILVQFVNGPGSLRTWNFTATQSNQPVLTGSLDADTGEILSFSRTLQTADRQAAPVIDLASAETIANNYITGEDGAVDLNISSATYLPLGSSSEPVAGQYTFVYNRVVQNILCDQEGFTIAVDSVTGDVIQYERRNSVPDDAFVIASEPRVPSYEAKLTVTRKAEDIYPASGLGLQIVSADLRWKDDIAPGTIPEPASIPFAWKVQFDDGFLRANQSPYAVGWVDPQAGTIIEMDYLH